MADKLETKLRKIEDALGGTKPTPNIEDKLGWHLDYIEDLIEEGGGGGGTTVIANPEMSGDEDDLVGLQVGNTKYKVSGEGGGSEVIANPTLEGDEDSLNSIEIDGTKYIVEGGSSESKHNIYIAGYDDGQEIYIDGEGPGSDSWNTLFEEVRACGEQGDRYSALTSVFDLLTGNEGTDFNMAVFCDTYDVEIDGNNETIQYLVFDTCYNPEYCGEIYVAYNVTRDEYYIDFTRWYAIRESRKTFI